MKLRVLLALVTVGVAAPPISSVQAAPPAGKAAAGTPDKAGDKSKAPKSEAVTGGQFSKHIRLHPRGLNWGISLAELSRLYEKAFDREYIPLLKKAQPGVEMRGLEEELKDKKELIKRNALEFGDVPTGIDNTPLKGEYAYKNNESMTRLTHRDGTVRNFFFHRDRLWKVYDEYKFNTKVVRAADFDSEVAYVTKKLGGAPRKYEIEKGRSFPEAVWSGKGMVVRAVDRGGDTVAFVYVDPDAQATVEKSRPKAGDTGTVDTSVSDVLRTNQPPPEEPKKGKGKEGKGKEPAKKK
jgi:hypothetical protein